MVDHVVLRWAVSPRRPEFTIEGGGRWPSLLARFPDEQVVVRYVVPEAVPMELYVPGPDELTLSGDIRLALQQLAGSLRVAGLRLGSEPPVSLSLSYPDDPDYEARASSVHEQFRDAVPPVLATVDVDRSTCSRKQRTVHDEALRSAVYKDQPLGRLGSTGFSTRLGYACLRDPGHMSRRQVECEAATATSR